jgi:lactate dehydrogenase-like 2-hydroxyacid dehydrogenase
MIEEHKPKIFLTRRWPARIEADLGSRYDVQINRTDEKLDDDTLRSAFQRYEIVCPTVSDRIGRGVMDVPNRRTRLIANFGAGTDHIDLDEARRLGIPVTNTPDVLTDATADTALLLMLMVSRRASEGERELRAGHWQGWHPTHLLGSSLSGKNLGLIGFGRIGQAVALKARAAFGMNIMYISRHAADADVERRFSATYLSTVDELASMSDVLSLHCPSVPATHHLVNAHILSLMKPTAMVINTSRGPVIDEAALAVSLATGGIAGAGLDVYEREPQITPALIECPNAVLLPHLGSATVETRVAMGMRVLRNIECFLAGEPLPDLVS